MLNLGFPPGDEVKPSVSHMGEEEQNSGLLAQSHITWQATIFFLP